MGRMGWRLLHGMRQEEDVEEIRPARVPPSPPLLPSFNFVLFCTPSLFSPSTLLASSSCLPVILFPYPPGLHSGLLFLHISEITHVPPGSGCEGEACVVPACGTGLIQVHLIDCPFPFLLSLLYLVFPGLPALRCPGPGGGVRGPPARGELAGRGPLGSPCRLPW